jgi:tetratricopeptide (TPR) repeat protein
LALHRPERQTLLPLDKGLNSPDAEDLLRSLDEDGRLGLRSASDAVLNEIRIRTLGIPRALEIFCAILNDPYSSLDEVLSDVEHYLPEEVVNRLSAEAFHRLDRTGQRVIQALAVFARPVIPEAVDFVLQPFEPALASEPTLRRLVRMYLARRESGHCFLHPVDQVYARAAIPRSAPAETAAASSALAYTLPNLMRRAAEYFRQIRTEQSGWTSIADVGPQLAEFDLLIEVDDISTALEVFDGIVGHLDRWGYRRQIVTMAEALRARATGAARAVLAATAGGAYFLLGEVELAIDRYEEALRTPGDAEPLRLLWWRLGLANSYLERQQDEAASRLFDAILRESPTPGADFQVEALAGLARIATNRNDKTTAELFHLRALDIYVPACGVDIQELGEGINAVVDSPNNLATADPAAWLFLGRLVPAEQSGTAVPAPEIPSSSAVVFGIRVLEAAQKAKKPGQEEELEENTSTTNVFPVAVDSVLAGIWMNLARLYERWDRYDHAYAACVLAGRMSMELEDDDGTLDALELLHRILANFSHSDAVAVIEDQQRLLEKVRLTGNPRLMGKLLQILASSYVDHDRLGDAEIAYSELRRVAIELEDILLREAAELGSARVMRLKGDYTAAVDRLHALLQEIGSRRPDLQGEVEYELGQIEMARYETKTAADHFEASARAYVAADNTVGRLVAEQQLASLAIDYRDYDSAIVRLERLLQLARVVDVPSVTSSTLVDLARAYSAGGRHEAASSAVDEARRIVDQIDVPLTRAETLLTIASIYTDQRRFDAAKEASGEARERYRQLGNARGQISALQSLAYICSLTVEPDTQLQAAREARDLAERMPDAEQRRQARMTVALALSDAERYDEAIGVLEDAIRERPTDARAVGNLGSVLFDAGHYELSVERSRLALKMDPAQSFALRNIGHALLALGRPDEAEQAYRRAIEERRGGENFHESIRYVKKLLNKQPQLPRGLELLALLEKAQETLERDWKDAARLREGR